MVFLKKTLPFLLFVFGLSAIARWPQIVDTSAEFQQDATVNTLRVLQHWEVNGAEALRYLPVIQTATDTDTLPRQGTLRDASGNEVYVAHPPFSYYAPYLVFQLLHIESSTLPLRVFNLSLHFVSGLFIYLIVSLLSFKRGRSLLHFPSFVAFTIYLFLPTTLWFQGNVYTADTAYMTLFIIGVYTILKMIIRSQYDSPKYLFFYSLCLFLMIYTSWLGYFFGGGVLVYSLLHLQKNRKHLLLIGVTLLVIILTFRMIVWQYAQVAGYRALMQEWLSLYFAQGSVSNYQEGVFVFVFSYFLWIKNILYNYLMHYSPLYLAGIYGLWIAVTRKKLRIVFSENGFRFIWLSITPVVLMHLLLMAYSAHAFTALYAALFFSVLSGILYDKIRKSGAISLASANKGLFIMLISLITLFHLIY